MRPPAGLPSLSKRSRVLLLLALIVFALLLIGPRVVDTYTSWLWFGEVGYRGVYVKVLLTRLILFVVVALIVGGIVFAALVLGYRSRPVFVPVAGPNDPIARYRTTVMARLRLFGIGIPLVVGLISGLVAQSNWVTVQMFLHREPFGITDPQFHLDIGFYAFDLPFYRMVLDWLFVAVVIAFFANLVTHYIFGGLRLTGRDGALTRSARIQLAVLAGTFVVLKAIAYWFDRYQLLSSERKDIFTGGSYTDINAVLPAKMILLAIAVVCALAFFAGIFLRDLRIPALATALLVLSSILVGAVWPMVMEQFSVKPNAADKEREYISRNIEATRQAYGITSETVTYEKNWGSSTPDLPSIERDAATLSNIRLLDPNLISPTFREQQKLRNFYGFPDQLAMDRYMVEGQLRDFVVAARELRPNQLDAGQRDWINRHTRFTHGNGFIAAPANTVDEVAQDAGNSARGGLPKYLVSDLSSIQAPEYANAPIQVTEPRIYFGELIAQADPDYSIVGANGKPPVEYDGEGSTNTYDGAGGVPIGNWFNRFAFAVKYGERNLLLSSEIGSESKIIYNRDPRDRVQKVAPWLTTDSKVYPAVVDGRIKWIVDGYTTLDHYPYAQQMSLDDATSDALETTGSDTQRTQAKKEVSYIRNSVKATVDAYDGTVTLYQQDENDPVLKAWMGVFPDTVVPKDEVPDSLRNHFRYPEDLFKVQRLLLGKYHVDDPGQFFQSNDFWQVPGDPTIPTNTRGLSQPPYYVVASDPTKPGSPSFQLTSVLLGLNAQFLTAYISVSSQPDSYGKITVKQLPTNVQTTNGPKQVYDQLTTADEIARHRGQLEQGAEVKYGNLLTLPVGKDGLLYVEPLFTQAKNQATAFPKLLRMLVFFNGKIGYAPTIGEALKQAGINADAVTTQPTQGSDGEPAQTDTDPGPQPGTTPTTPDDGSSPVTQAQRDAVAKLAEALTEVRAAQQSGDFERYGRALAALDTAVAGYQAVQGG